VQPEEVEAVLREMPGVADARVLAASDPRRGEQIVACLVADRGAGRRVDGRVGITTLAVRRFCAARLSPHKIPRAVLLVEAIPMTPRGKTDRVALQELVRARLGSRLEAL
jgi:acyl-CoA synthetase (AMP-forming)/AMP-acid ligase II